MTTIHTTKIARTAEPGARALLAETIDGTLSNTKIEIAPLHGDLFTVAINQIERLPHHRKGMSRSLSFVIDRAGLDHICGVGNG